MRARIRINYGSLAPAGPDRWPAGGGVPDFPHEIPDVRKGQPLRFNNSRYAGRQIADSTLPRGRAADYIRGLIPEWDRLCREFFEAYLCFVDIGLRCAGDELEVLVAAHGGLFARDDWWFSSLKPMPQAHVHLAGESAPPADAVCDFLFFDGHELIGFERAGSAGPRRARRDRYAYFDRIGLRMVPFDRQALSDPSTFFASALPGSTAEFWRGEFIPLAPFGPALRLTAGAP